MTSANATMTEKILQNRQSVTVAGLIVLTALSWVWILAGAGTGMNTLAMTTLQFPPPVMDGVAAQWTLSYGLVMLAMWWIMMIAMMTPSAAPMILLYGQVARQAQKRGQMAPGPLPTVTFITGYLLAWLGFSVLATAAQWGFEKSGLVHQMLMWSTNDTLTGLLLVTAGLFQLTPLKAACLEHCRSPAAYLSQNWCNGRSGALQMGMVHGAYCLGCCWALMTLLFAGGVMNLVWIAGLSIVVLIEKVAPQGVRLGQGLAAMMTATGFWLLIQT